MNKKSTAILTGLSIIIIAIIAAFSIGYALTALYQNNQEISLKVHIRNNHELYIQMLFGLYIILFLDIVVSYSLYRYFKKINKKIALWASSIRLIYTLIFGFSIIFLIQNAQVNELTNSSINSNYHQFLSIWNVGLIIFGVHILMIGKLMKQYKSIPKILSYITLLAGLSYILVHVLKLTNPTAEIVLHIEMVLIIPMALGELGLAIWLLFKGALETTRITYQE
ncbi:DUF4386 domain-containing protein [Polaribacter sp. Asnod6-C07]|uniref:DUF4386 domain-containing protein n=1 Tax=Polaribacter sp. Asnod6-C07 TaxID=3160582 RepID=UPI003867B6AA